MAQEKDISQLSTDINSFLNDVLDELPGIVESAALTANAKIKDRIQKTGIDANGNSLKPYSEKYEKRKAARYGEESIRVTNLTLTGNMWRETQLIETTDTGSEIVATVGARTTDAADKIDYNSERYGDIMRLNTKEQNEINGDMIADIDTLVQKSNLFK
jgi:hypothetical protein